jgi:hypothetical protein
MNRFITWCFRIGLACGLVAFASAMVGAVIALGVPFPSTVGAYAQSIFTFFATVFMSLGIVLLIAAVVWLRRSWAVLSRPVKVVSVLGLGVSTFVGAYIFYWLLPDLQGSRKQT